MINIYLDDIRETPNGFYRVFSSKECCDALLKFKCNILSLDHDLGNDDIYGTGYDVLNWLEEKVYNGMDPPNKILIHSSNSAKIQKMIQAIDSIYRIYNERK